MRLLLVEDDADMAEVLTLYLERHGFVVDRAPDLAMARTAIEDNVFDIVLLDRVLPDGDGVELIAHAERHDRPQRFLVLTALGEIDDRVSGLESGARDYMAKPFEPRELVARIRNVLRQEIRRQRVVRRFGPIVHDVENVAFLVDGEPLQLRRSEALVLAALMVREGALVHRETLESSVYGYDKFVNPNSLESTVSRLRKALALKTDHVRIATVRGIGYYLAEA